jgi:hypothetical protein
MKLDDATKRRFRKLHLDSRVLLDTFVDRLPEKELADLSTFSFVGEWGLLVDGLCANLVKQGIPVTPAEHDEIAAVLAQFHGPKDPLYEFISDPDATLAALTITR